MRKGILNVPNASNLPSPQGSPYEGMFSNAEFEGQGIFYWATGLKFEFIMRQSRVHTDEDGPDREILFLWSNKCRLRTCVFSD